MTIVMTRRSITACRSRKPWDWVSLTHYYKPLIQKEASMGMLKEFKEFAVKGNMVDLAVGIIIGGAFGKVVSSIVSDVLMPPLGFLIGGINFTDIKIPLKASAIDVAGKTIPGVTINIGNFIQ